MGTASKSLKQAINIVLLSHFMSEGLTWKEMKEI